MVAYGFPKAAITLLKNGKYNLPSRYDFFLPWAGMEKASYQNENPADVKASEKMAKIYDEIQKQNQFTTEADLLDLNIFLSRLLFCFLLKILAFLIKHLLPIF